MRLFWLVGLLIFLVGCGANTTPEIVPFESSAMPNAQTATFTPFPTATFQLLPTVTLAPTRTPFPTAPRGSAPTLPILPTYTPAPVTQTATFVISTDALQIEYFASDTNNPLANGDTLTLFWRVVGATEAQIFQVTPQGRRSQVWRVAPEGAISVRIRAGESDTTAQFVIQAEFRGTVVEDSLTIPLVDCEGGWFFSPAPNDCPSTSPEFTGQVEQVFENGRMLWLANTQTIYVLYTDEQSPAWESFPDTYTIDAPERDESLVPPPDRYQPIRGFGLVWRENPTLRERLGWAIAPEFGYDGVTQQAGGDSETLYLRVSEGGIVALQADSWELVTATTLTPTPDQTATSEGQ